MAVFYIQSTSPSLSQDDYIILVIWVLNIFMLFLCCNMFILHHLARQCPLRTTEWGWVCPWSNWAPQMLPSFSHSCWSGSLPGGSVIIRKKTATIKEFEHLTLALRVVPVTCWMSNQNPWIFLSGFKPSTASWYFASACRKCGQERTGGSLYMWDFQKGSKCGWADSKKCQHWIFFDFHQSINSKCPWGKCIGC